MNYIPVLFRTYNRLQYFYYTLRSFFSTDAKYKCSVQIIDDCSQQQSMKKFLYSNECFNFNFNMQTDCRFSAYKSVVKNEFSKLQPLTKIQGIYKSLVVTKTRNNKGDKSGLLWTIKHGFQKNPNAQFIIILQNDVLFNEQWLDKLLHIYNKNKQTAGVVSCWNLHNNYLNNSTKIQDYLKLNKGQGIGFPVALITRKFYQRLFQTHKDDFDKQYCKLYSPNLIKKQNEEIRQNFNLAGDHFVLKRCYQLGFDVFSTQKSCIQHIGVGSTCRYWEKTCWYRSQLFEGQFQYNNLNVGNVYIFSNVQAKRILNVNPNDVLVFLNWAKNFKQYQNLNCRKLLFRRYLVSRKTYTGKALQNVEHYYINGEQDNLPIKYSQLEKEYDYNYKTTAPTKQPTTGWLVYKLCKQMFPYHNIKLVNFFPNSDFSTQHDCTHNWKFEDLYYKINNVDIIDCRQNNLFSKQKLYQEQHKIKKDYGCDSHRFFNLLMQLKSNKNINSILDYGCGKATLGNKFKQNKVNIQFYNYDFAISEYNVFPNGQKFDLVVCTDVLQHVPQNQLNIVLDQIISVSDKAFFSISLRAAINKLPNGQNCHCTVKEQSWWLQFLKKYFKQINKFQCRPKQLVCYCQK